MTRCENHRRLDQEKTRAFVETVWNESVLATLTEYIRIPNKSPLFDTAWREHGFMDQAVDLFVSWAQQHAAWDMKIDVLRSKDRTPLIVMEIPGASDDTVLLYGHLDKQPEMTGWKEGLGPWTPVLRGERLYGRGGADDGYAMFAALTAINALHDQNVPHARCVILIEACEESGSEDLPYYIDSLADRIGTPSLIICLDSGCGNYDQLWCTTSLRGVVIGKLKVELLSEGVHSGDASGIVASSFRVLRQILSRLEDPTTGRILLESLHVEIPGERVAQARTVADVLGTEIWDKFPMLEGVKPVTDDLVELVLNRTWRPTLSVTGVDGIPSVRDAGNVMRPQTTLTLSMRLPPTAAAASAIVAMRKLLESEPPYGAKVTFESGDGASGWNASPLAPWLAESAQAASRAYFGGGVVFMGEGGSIPFMGMLGEKFPQAQFLITGVLGPGSNAHGPNEFLDLPTAKRLTCCAAQVLRDHFVAS